MTALLLGAYGFALSRVVPVLLARARWTWRAPRAAVVLWQCVVLASGLSALGVVLAGPQELARARDSDPVVAQGLLVAALVLAAVIVGRLVVALVAVLRRSRARRERHRTLVDLLGTRADRPDLDAAEALAGVAAVRVLDGPVPLAYCIPGRSPRVVLSDGVLAALDRDELAAVLAHEQAHLRARHDLVLESFTAVQRAVPSPLRSTASLPAVHLLLEMLADDGARRLGGPEPLRRALTTLGGAVSATVSPASDAAPEPDADRAARLARLAPEAAAPSWAVEAGAYLGAVALLVVPTLVVVLPWLLDALATLPLER